MMPHDTLPIGPLRCLWLHIRCWRRRHPKWGFWMWVIIYAVFVALGISAGVALGDEEKSLRPLFDALWQVEASRRLHPPDGDDCKSIGPYQIGEAYWLDARMPDGSWQDCRKKAYAERVMKRYWRRYRAVTDERRARMHNGGPNGCRKKATLAYWKRVRAAMKGAIP